MKEFFFIFILFGFTASIAAQDNPRTKLSLNSNWEFHKGSLKQAGLTAEPDQSWETVNIPHTWNTDDIIDEKTGYYRGEGWYKKELFISNRYKNDRLYVHFEAVGQKAEVYVNGQQVGSHKGAYTAFSFDITPYVKYGKENILTVKADNTHDKNIPPLSGDFSTSGGIYRDASLIITSPVHFDMNNLASPGVFIETPTVDDNSATIRIRGKINNASAGSRSLLVNSKVFSPDNDLVKELKSNLEIAAGNTSGFQMESNTITPITLWSPENPALYRVVTEIIDPQTKTVLDKLTQPLGFRWFSVSGKDGFFLNGKPYTLKGAARHQDHKNFGVAVPNEVHYSDMKLLKDMGANFVRISHYPQDPEVYRACDELGLIAWSEIPIVNEITLSDDFFNNCKTMMKEMILQNYNHPSVAIWAYMNEVFGAVDWFWEEKSKDVIELHKQKTTQLAQELEQLTRKLDPYRLTAIACHTDPTPELYKETMLTDIPMITGWNIYQGWYHNDLSWTGKKLDEFHAFNPDNPLFIAEYGAGSDPRIHTYEPTIFDFSTEYQCEFQKAYLEEGNKRNYIAGFSIWNLVDFQRDGRKDAVPNINSKGVTTTEREPKDAYYLYQAYWSEKPMAHIAAKHWTERVAITDSEQPLNKPVEIFTNQPSIELIVNGKSLGEKKTENNVVSFEVPFTHGHNELVANTAMAEDRLDIRYHFISPSFDNMKRLNINVGQSRTFFNDFLTGNIWIPDRAYNNNTLGYVNGEYYRQWSMEAWQGIREGVDYNILGTQIDPVFQTFLVGITDYKIDVPAGAYNCELYLAEPFPKERRSDAEQNTGADANGERVFSVFVNDKLVIENLNLAQDIGEQRALVKTIDLSVSGNEGIHVRLEPVKGEAILCGIGVVKKNEL